MDAFEFRERMNSGVDPEIEDLAYRVIGAAIEVHTILKPGMPENAYKLALSHELKIRGIEHECEVHEGQAIGYLQMMSLQLALLLNFNVQNMKQGIKRVINTYQPLRV